VSFLLDTNVVSEWVKPRPNRGVVSWLAEADEDRVFISVITLAELHYGIERLATGQRRRHLEEWLEQDLPLRFERRVLPISPAIADACGRILVRSERVGRPLQAMDAFLAATAEVHQLTLVSHNTDHFTPVFKSVLDPWVES
jgi:predicted nucleic acid-binding protein